jgi:hypothetical protein
MNPEAQAFLAQLLAAARRRPPSGRERTKEDAERAFVTFTATLQAFKVVGAVDQDETHEWTNRMLVALGEDPLEPAGPGEIRLIRFGDDSGSVDVPEPTPEFIRLLPASSEATASRFGGRFQVLGIEMYDSQFAVVWRLAPLPDQEAMFAVDIAELEGDTEGLPDERRAALKRQLIQRLSMHRQQIEVSDDLGTQYHSSGGGSGGGGNERTGRMVFHPVPPPDATILTVRWEDVVHEVLLTS